MSVPNPLTEPSPNLSLPETTRPFSKCTVLLFALLSSLR